MNFIKRFFAVEAVVVKNGVAKCVKGKFIGRALRDIQEVLQEAGLKNGEIWISKDKTISFSSDIPGELHQRLRNVVSSK